MDLTNFDAIIFDMDGVLRCGSDLVEGAKNLMEYLSSSRTESAAATGNGDTQMSECLILTNECRYTHASLYEQFKQMKSPIPPNWRIYTSADSVKDFLLSRQDFIRGIHVLGESGLFNTLNDAFPGKLKNKLPCIDLAEHPESELYVVIGSLDKQKQDAIQQAAKWIKCGAKVLTTCPDLSDPGSKGDTVISMPCNTLQILKKLVPCHHYCLGKPNPLMITAALKLLRQRKPDIDPSRILFIGDSLDTDIKCAFEAGMKSVLVLTGNTSVFGIKHNVLQPTYVFHSVEELYEVLKGPILDKKNDSLQVIVDVKN